MYCIWAIRAEVGSQIPSLNLAEKIRYSGTVRINVQYNNKKENVQYVLATIVCA